MKRMLTNSIYALFIGFSALQAQTTAEYNIEFTSNWEENSKTALPATAHFTKLVVATHNSNVTYFEMNQPASPEVERIAELGVNGPFINKVSADIRDSNTTFNITEGENLFFNTARKTITINNLKVNSDFPLLTLASMLAPSPDWMIGVNSLSLQDANGAWIPEITMDLFVYDAGTEDGNSYSLNNNASNPRGVITKLTDTNTPININEKIGTLVITLKNGDGSTLSTNDFNSSEYTNLDFYPNPAKEIVRITNVENSNLKTIELFNISGTLVKVAHATSQDKTVDVNLSNLSQGLYLMRFTTKTGETQTKRLTITK